MPQFAEGRASGPGPVLLLAAVAVGGLVFFREPLLSSRPKESASFPVLRAVDETVEARLWQDPLQAIRRDWDRLVTYRLERDALPPSTVAPPTIERMSELIDAHLQEDRKTRRLLILATLVTGGPYADNAEARRRDRYAMISALTGAEYVPTDPQRVGYFLAPRFASSSGLTEPLTEACVPPDDGSLPPCPLADPVSLIGFEWFRPSVTSRRNASEAAGESEPTDAAESTREPESGDASEPGKAWWESVLVLWLNNREFGEYPLRHVESLLAELVPRLDEHGVRAVLIGPPDSGSLHAMYHNRGDGDRAADAAVERFRHAVDGFPRDARELLLTLGARADTEPGPDGTLPTATNDAPAAPAPGEPADEFDPNPRELDSVSPKHVNVIDFTVDEIVSGVDGYLDYGLPQAARADLAACLNATDSNLDSCLEEPAFDQIKDSDPSWRDTVGFLFDPIGNRPTDRAYPEDVAGLVTEIAGNRAWVRSLLMAAHEYLDYGLPRPDDTGALTACLDAVRRNDGESIVAPMPLADCLREHLVTEDLDRVWPLTVAEGWLARNGPLEAVPAAAGRDVEIVRSPAARDAGRSGIRRSLHVLSPRSTVPIELLLRNATNGYDDDPANGDREIAETLGVATFRSVLARDHVVLRAVADELIERGLDVDCTDTSSVAIVYELDSSYGRAMRHVLEHGILSALGCENTADDLAPEAHSRTFGYLRGLDGELPPSARAESSASNAQQDDDRTRSRAAGDLFAPIFEPPVGRSQTDYIRRLADQIARAHLRSPGEGFQAIGVFGTDIYDKQLVLQALRERLPGVRLFTTDLDARLTDPEEYRWNANLIVGSAYGLTKDPAAGQTRRRDPVRRFEVPPFRDSYQTALYTAVDEALHDTDLTDLDESDRYRPRVFEIARTGAIDITRCDATGGCARNGWLDHAGDGFYRGLRILALVSPLLVLGLVSYTISRRSPAVPLPVIGRAHAFVCRMALASAGVIGVSLAFWRDPNLEPLFLFEGISAVPTLVLHATAIVYALAIIIIGAGRIRLSDTRLASEFLSLDVAPQVQDGPDRSGSAPRVSLTKWHRDSDELASGAAMIDVHEVWARYRELGRPAARALRALPWAALLTFVVIVVIRRDADPLLARGIADGANHVRIATALVVLISVYLFSDGLRVGQTFIHALSVNDIDGYRKFPESHAGLPYHAKCRWRTMQLIVGYTESIGPLMVLPFVLVFLLLIARNTLFDGWVWTPTLIAIYGGFSIHLLVRALLFQREASAARDRILDRLELQRHESGHDERVLRRIELVMEEIRGIHSGAFVPWTRHPLLQSIALPSGGVGVLALLNLLAE